MPCPARSVCKHLPSTAQAEAAIASDAVYQALTSEFDAVFYAQEMALPIRSISFRSRRRLLAHYITTGWKEGMNPSRQFDAARYLDRNPDVAAAGMEPLRHFLVYGREEGREAFLADGATDAVHTAALLRMGLTHDDLRAVTPWFDETFYHRAYPDLRIAGGDALIHYLEHGWKEGRDPSPEFSTDFYLAANPDVAASGIVPLLHFARTGHTERRPHRFFGTWRGEYLARVAGLASRARQWKRQDPARRLAAPELEARIAGSLGDPTRVAVVIALLQDRYYDNVGGIQLCAQDEQRRLNDCGHSYIAINPYQPLPHLYMEDGETWLCDVSVDGHFAGTASGVDVLIALEHLLRPYRCGLTVHSLLGHSCDWLERLGQAVRFDRRLFWVHDYFSLCTGFNLLRNDVSPCDAPPLESNSCRLCVHGAGRALHLDRLRLLFSRMSFEVLAPSTSALALWSSRTSLPFASAKVLPHREFEVLPGGRPARPTGRALRVAFAGQPAAHKGWFVFRDFAQTLRKDARYAWYHLGATSDPQPNVSHVYVRHSIDNPHAMQRAIEAHEIDVVLILSQCPETYCLTAHESVAGGAFVFALARGGHVVDLVRSTGAGEVVESEQDLLMALLDGSLVAAVDRYHTGRPAFGALVSSGSSVALLMHTGADPE